MDRHIFFEKLSKLGLNSRKTYMDRAFTRNIGIFSEEEQILLADKKVGIPGMGGVGGSHLITLARTGIGSFHISDYDSFDVANINRQYGASVDNFGVSKLDTMKNQALSINPFIRIKEFRDGITAENIDSFIDGLDVVVDSLDFYEFDLRRLLFNRALEKGVYVITAGPMGFSSAMLIFSPFEGMNFDDFFGINDDMNYFEKLAAFSVGLSPKATHRKYYDLSKVDINAKTGPSSYIACQLCSAMAATEVVRILLKKGELKPVPFYTQFDPFTRKFSKGKVHFGKRNLLQYIKIKAVKKIAKKKAFF